MRKPIIKFRLLFFIYKNLKYILLLLAFIALLFLIAFITIIYKDIQGKNLSTYCYALFLANIVVANCLFSLGRSNIFIERFTLVDQKKIYNAGVLFLTSALLTLIFAGTAYFENINIEGEFFKEITERIFSILTSIFLSISSILSIIGIVKFFSWISVAMNLHNKEMEKEMQEKQF